MSKELHLYCKEQLPHLQILVEKLRNQKQPLPIPTGFDQVHQLMGALTELQSSVDTLLYVEREYHGKSGFSKLLEAAGGMDATPDYGYFGPAPEFSVNPSFGGAFTPTVSGTAALAGFAGDLTSAVTALVKQHLALKKQIKQYSKDSGPLKNAVRVAYCALVDMLAHMMVKCADSETEAAKYFKKGGLNKPIVQQAWQKAQRYAWCATVS